MWLGVLGAALYDVEVATSESGAGDDIAHFPSLRCVAHSSSQPLCDTHESHGHTTLKNHTVYSSYQTVLCVLCVCVSLSHCLPGLTCCRVSQRHIHRPRSCHSRPGAGDQILGQGQRSAQATTTTQALNKPAPLVFPTKYFQNTYLNEKKLFF